MTRVFRVIAAFVLVLPLVAGSAIAAPARAKAGKSQALVGTLQKVDGQTLTVQTAKGTETVMLASNAQLRHGSKKISASDLASQTGSRVKIRFSDTNGQKQARSVMVSSGAAKHARADAAGAAAPATRASKK